MMIARTWARAQHPIMCAGRPVRLPDAHVRTVTANHPQKGARAAYSNAAVAAVGGTRGGDANAAR
jgi:hypothetical protein